MPERINEDFAPILVYALEYSRFHFSTSVNGPLRFPLQKQRSIPSWSIGAVIFMCTVVYFFWEDHLHSDSIKGNCCFSVEGLAVVTQDSKQSQSITSSILCKNETTTAISVTQYLVHLIRTRESSKHNVTKFSSPEQKRPPPVIVSSSELPILATIPFVSVTVQQLTWVPPSHRQTRDIWKLVNSVGPNTIHHDVFPWAISQGTLPW